MYCVSELPTPVLVGNSEPFPGETLVADGWVYRDFPAVSLKCWQEVLSIAGEGNLRLLVMTIITRKGDPTKYVRGQALVSPEGMSRLINHSSNRKEPSQ